MAKFCWSDWTSEIIEEIKVANCVKFKEGD